MNHDELEKQLLLHVDDIIKIILKGNTAEIRKNKDGILVLDVEKKKLSKNFSKPLD